MAVGVGVEHEGGPSERDRAMVHWVSGTHGFTQYEEVLKAEWSGVDMGVFSLLELL